MSLIVLLIAIGVAVSPLVNSIQLTPEVKIESGTLQGSITEVNNTGGLKVRRYLGIPFAQAKRFENPEPPKSWSGVRKMVTLGKACPQVIGPLGAPRLEDVSEDDCLNLNVFVPDNITSSERLPVMVWIYGGGFAVGSNRGYDGSYIAALGGVVVVVINYRVSVFGFLTNGKDIKGNYGMFDQVEGLKWVQKNIEKFNGDPNKVTIFGESAGGASVSLLVLSKRAEKLFHRAIPQSGDASAFWACGAYERRVNSIKIFANNVGCPDLGKLKDCLEDKKIMEIINASLAAPWPNFVPVIDKNFLDDDPMVLYEKQDFQKYDIMMGATNDEGTVFSNAVGPFGMGLNVTYGVSRETFVNTLSIKGGLAMVIPDPKSVLINATIHQYTDYTNVSSITRNRRMYLDLMGDIGFVAPAIRGANAYAKKKASTYFYSFEHRYGDDVMGFKVAPWIKAYHGADVSFVFGAPLLNSTTTSTDTNFTRDIIKLWTNFAKTGNPNQPASVGVTWPEYNLEEQKYMPLKPKMAVNSHLRSDYMSYWNWFIPNALRAAPKPCNKCDPCSKAGDKNAAGAVVLLLSMFSTWFQGYIATITFL